MKNSPRSIGGISELVDQYDAFFVDAWGVLHDGRTPYPGAIDCLERLMGAGKQVVILSNSANRENGVADDLTHVGIGPQHYHFIVCSGELTHEALAKTNWSRCFHIGQTRGLGLLQGLSIGEVDSAADADFIFATGPTALTGKQMRPIFDRAIESRKPMVCANPDWVAVRAEVLGIAPGALARVYRRHGGAVIAYGKPDTAIYQSALAAIPGVKHNRILAIGDGMVTDIVGANRAGIDCVFVKSGIHAKALSRGANALCERHNAQPDYVVKGCVW